MGDTDFLKVASANDLVSSQSVISQYTSLSVCRNVTTEMPLAVKNYEFDP